MSYYRLFYHVVWATKDRLPLITPANVDAIYGVIATKVDKIGGIVHALNGMPDHVHLVVTVPPVIALAAFVGQIKGASSHLARRLATTAGNELFTWQAEYGVVSVSERHLPLVIGYVRQQQQHHAEHTLNRTFESCGSGA